MESLQVKNYQKCAESCLIAVGANLPSREGSAETTIGVAFERIARESLEVIKQSRLYKTPAFPKGAGPDFINAALEIKTTLGPDELMGRLHHIEATLGRERHSRWEARVLDIDLLSFGSEVFPDRKTQDHWRLLPPAECAIKTPRQLIVPHPRLQDRGFVLVPLMDIAPDWIHPVLGLSVRQMHARLSVDDLAGIDVI